MENEIVEVYVMDGNDRPDVLLPGSFYMEAYTNNDEIWIGKNSEDRKDPEYYLESAHEGYIFSSDNLVNVVNYFFAIYNVQPADEQKILDSVYDYLEA